MSQPRIKPQTVSRREERETACESWDLQAPPVTASTRGMRKHCFRKVGLAVVSAGKRRGGWKGIRDQVLKENGVSEDGKRVDSSYEGERIKVTKQIRVTRNVMEPLRKLDEFGRCLFFFFFNNKSVMHSFHTYECKGIVNVSGRHTNSHLLSLQTSFFHLTFKLLCSPTRFLLKLLYFCSSTTIKLRYPPLEPPTDEPACLPLADQVSRVHCCVHLHSHSLQ